MPSIDERIVRMQFDNAEFERKIGTTLASLAQLDKSLGLTNAAKGLTGLNAAANQVNLSGMASALDNISGKFSAMGAIGFSVIQALTQEALHFLGVVGKDLFAPIFEGGLTRAKAIEQAQFMFRGLGVDVTAAMNSAREAVLGTAYGLGSAAKAAAQFAAAGIPVGEKMTSALRAVAGAAAMTGASFDEIAYIWQGIAAKGRVDTQDLMQFATRGLNAAAAVAKALGITEQEVREMVTNGQLDFQTFTKAMDDAFGKHATAANETFVGSLANVKAALSRLGAAFISPQLLNFRDIFNAITPVVDAFTKAIQPAIDAFTFLTTLNTGQLVEGIKGISFENLTKAMPSIVDGMVNISKMLYNIWNIGKQAFQQIFPPSVVPTIVKMAEGFKNFTASLQVTVDGMTKIRSIFEGFFSILSIGWTIIKEGTKFLINLGKSIAGIFGPGVVGGLTKVSDFFTSLQDSLVKGGGIKSFFDGLTESLKKPLEFLEKVKNAISELFSGFSQGAATAVEGTADRIGDRFDTLKNRLSDIWGPFKTSLMKIADVLEQVWTVISNWFEGLWDRLAAGLSSDDFQNILDAVNTGLLGGIALILGRFLKGGFNFTLGAGWMNIGGTFQQLTGTLTAMQTNLKSEALMKIAKAIALLTVSVVALSLIDSEALTRALAAMSAGFVQLIGAFAALEKISAGPKGALDFNLIASGMILLAGAMLVLAVAVKILSSMEWNELVKGLTATMALLIGLSLASKPLSANSKGMISAGIGIQALAVGLVIMAAAMKIMASMSWEELAKGLIGISVGLGAIVIALKLMPNDLALVKAGTSIMFIATAMTILGGAVAIFASMDWESLGKGLLGMSVGLGAIVLALNLMPKDMGASTAAILGVSIAIIAMATAMKMIAGLSWEEIAKGLTGIAVSLGLLVGASILMEGAIPGAGAMLMVAGALLILSKAIETIGKLSWEEMIRGLVGLALGLGLIAGAATLLSPAVPQIMALGVALIFLGGGIALIGVGAVLLAKALEIIARTGEQAIKMLPELLEAIAKSIPAFLKGIAEGVVEMIKVFTDAAPSIAKALGILLIYIIDTIIKAMPKIVELLNRLMGEFLKAIRKWSPEIVATGMQVILDFLQGISDNIEKIVTMVADIITKFLDAMANETPRVVDSLVNTIGTFFTETARGLGELAPTILLGVGIAFIEGFIDGMEQQLSGPGANWFLSLPGKILGWIGDAFSWLIQKGIDIINGLISGLESVITNVTNFFTSLPGKILGWIGDTFSTLINKGADFINGLWTGMVNVFNNVLGWVMGLGVKLTEPFLTAGKWLLGVGESIIQGLWDGMKAIWHKVEGWLGSIKDTVVDFVTDPFDVSSPSKVMMKIGEYIMLGLHIGMKNEWDKTETWLKNFIPSADIAGMGDQLIDKMLNPIGDVARSLSDLPEFNPTITPVLDLTRIAADARLIGGYIQGSANLTPSVSLNNARAIAFTHHGSQQQSDLKPKDLEPREVKFEQIINAPTTLSASEIYKQTRNQITMAKEELSIP